MIISIPFIDKKEFIEDNILDFFNGVDIPIIQGGREPSFVNKVTPNLNETIKNIERFGKRYKVLATSTEPKWNLDVEKLMGCLSTNKGILIVVDLEFAQKVKDKYPNIELHASCIAGLKYPFKELLESSLFEVVGLPNTWHKYYESILNNVPKKHRERVNVIVLKYCIWDERCWEHYSQISKWYKEGNIIDSYVCPQSKKIMRYFKGQKFIDNIGAGFLYKEGFRRFKLAARIALNLNYETGKQLLRERILKIKKDTVWV